MLSVVAHEINPAHRRSMSGKCRDDVPTMIPATIIHENDLKGRGPRGQDFGQRRHNSGIDDAPLNTAITIDSERGSTNSKSRFI